MTRQHLALATVLMLAAPFAGAQGLASSRAAIAAQPVVLEAVVVTPKASYSAAEWQARQASRQLATAAPVMLEKVIVTPSRSYTVAEWRVRSAERRYAATELRKARHWLRAVWHTLGFKSYPQEV
ncbi:MAG: hypothetical protein Q8Q73_14085 [Stagnimonas sp.]|nr:hypothetical protein [Stagnimonas sp.]